MYFKKLEIFGFKSFADKTEILFEPGVTAIVGPNGCGKSNISDGIRWVLGEQSAKSLRGSSMEDVIFNGSSSRDAQNLAEVSLTLANETRLLAIDYDEVVITRRLYRSGDSEYLLNKNVVRLKDIQELLLGTGIGTEGYSIIEQGKMDQVINAKPDQRREIFEEAAGITKFKAKKKEALRKLEQTEQNLLRVNDIIQEVKRQIGSMERQAKKAESYKIEFEKLKNLEIAVASKEFLSLEAKLKFAQENLEALREEVSNAENGLTELAQSYHEQKEALHELEVQASLSQSKIFEIDARVQKSRDRVLLNRERIGELVERRENLTRQIEDTRTRAAGLSQEFERLDAQLSMLKGEEEEAVVVLQSAESDFNQFQSQVASTESERHALRVRLNELGDEKNRWQSEFSRATSLTAGLQGRLKRIKSEEEALLAEIREASIGSGLPLFENAGQEGSLPVQTPVERLNDRFKNFKTKLIEIFQNLFQAGKQSPGAEEELLIESEIQRFTDDVVGLHAQTLEYQTRQKALTELRNKLEAKLAVIAGEIQQVLNEENALLEKEQTISQSLNQVFEEERNIAAQILKIEESFSQSAVLKDEKLIRLTQARSEQASRSAKCEQIEKDRAWVESSRRSEEAQILNFEKEVMEAVSKKDQLEEENLALEEESMKAAEERDEILRQSEGLRRDLEDASARLELLETQKDEKEDFIKECRDKAHHAELENAKDQFEISRLRDRVFNAYNFELTIEALATLPESEISDLDEARAQIQTQKDKIQKLGPVNLAAMQEYDEMRERYDFLTKQEQDLVQAKEDLHKAILKINRTTRELFAETFEKVQQYFSEYYKILFNGGTAELVLLDADNILESGIEIVARPPGKKLQNISLLSGGEKALTAVAMVFALFKVRPSPFCVLDEIDAPLDETNVERFCNVLKEFITGSQFILITHNKRTMSLADAMYGITMAQTGVSRIVSVKFSEKAKEKDAVKDKDKEEVLV